MTREEAKSYINPKLLSDDLIILGDGDKFDLIITDSKIDRLADLELIDDSKKDSA
jgi:acid stress-induced BolA-like protein IbaG/YrbA